MEEAIAVLEKRVEIDRALRDGSVESDYDEFCENECLAIEKVINGYRKVINGEDILKEAVKENLELKEYIRELEERVKVFDKAVKCDKCDCNICEAEKIILNSIPKSKIKEKIEELNKEEKGLRNSISAEEYAEYSDANISFDLMHIEIQRSVLQELMEDSNETDSQF